MIEYDASKLEIAKEDRAFKLEETLNILDETIQKSVIVYFLSDLVLVTERDGITNKLIKFIEIDHLSFCKNVNDQKYFSYLFSLKGKNLSITFQCENKEHKKLTNLIHFFVGK
jgi:hypothetical protein